VTKDDQKKRKEALNKDAFFILQYLSRLQREMGIMHSVVMHSVSSERTSKLGMLVLYKRRADYLPAIVEDSLYCLKFFECDSHSKYGDPLPRVVCM
jgi:hypothetical protein